MSLSVDEFRDRVLARRDLPPAARRRKLREDAGVSVREIAETIGVSVQAVRLWEAGLRRPRPENLAAYVQLLRILEEQAG